MDRGKRGRADATEANRRLGQMVPELWFVGQWDAPGGRWVAASFDPTRGRLAINGHQGWMVEAATEAGSLLGLADALRDLIAGRVPTAGVPTDARGVRASQEAHARPRTGAIGGGGDASDVGSPESR